MENNENLEAQAIEALVNELTGEQPAEPEKEAEAEKPAEPAQETKADEVKAEPAPEPKADEPSEQTKINTATLEALQGILAKLNEKPAEPQKLSPEQETLNELGLSGLAGQMAQIQAAQKEQAAAMAAQKEAERRAGVFRDNLDKLQKEFPTIDPDTLGKWATSNGFNDFLGEDYNGWKLVAKAMINVAAPKQEPDPITSSSGASAAPSAFDKLKKGEEVDDLEIGADILQLAGMKY